MNKIVLAILLFFSSLHVAHAQLVFSFGSDTIANANGTVDVDVLVSGYDDIVLFQTSINWDADVFQFASIENVTTELPEFSASSIGTPDNSVVLVDGQITLSWSKVSTEPESLPDGTRLFTIRLNGAGNQCGTTTMAVSSTPREIEAFDVDFNEVTVSSSGGALATRDNTCTNNGGGGDLGLTLGEVMGAAGSSICVPVTGTNFEDILSLSTGVLWDPNVLTFTELREGALPSITANSAAAGDGRLRVLWFFDQEAVTVPDGTTLFEVCFDVTGSTGQSTQISLGNIDDFIVEISNSEGAIDNVILNNVNFTVGSGGNNSTGTGLIAPDIFTNNQPNVCIPVTTRNFNNIGALQTGISFDNSVLTFDRIISRGLSDVTLGPDAATGGLRLLWQASFAQTDGVTLPDNEVLFELCFDVIGGQGARSEIGFVNLNNLDIEIINVDAMAVESFVDDGSITVGEEMISRDASLTISRANATRGASVCLDVAGTGLSEVEGMGFTIGWDPSVVTFVETRNFNLSGLNQSSFNLSGNNRLVGVYTPQSPQSIADGSSVFQICFQAVDPCGTNQSTSVGFVSGNTPNEIISGGAAQNATFNDGNISITNCNAGSLEIELINVNQPACANAASGLVSVEFNNASGTVMCLWKNDADGLAITANCNLIGVPGGSYTLTAEDQSGSTATRTVVLNEPTPIVIEGDVTDGTCSGGGAISVRVSGGTTANGSYGFTWDSGLPNGTAVQNDLPAGTYRVTVVDDNNCQTVQQFSVNDNSISLDPVVTPLTDPDNPNGSIDLRPAAAGLTFSWSSGQTTSSISGLNSGSYTVTITDPAANCTVERTFVVDAGFVSGVNLIDAVTTRYNGFGVSCTGEQDGELSGEIIGGCSDGPVSIFLNGNAITLPAGNLPVGDHVLRIEDACGNTFEESFTITEPDPIENTMTDITCPNNGEDGAITLNLTGGTGNYTLTSGVGTANGTTIEGLAVGVYTVIAEDENGCQVMFENLEIPEDCNPVVGPEPCGARSIITPNGDGENDAFIVNCRGNTPINNLTIYDRWGNLVMESANYNNDWLGTDMSGQELPEGGYMWVLTTGNAGSRDIFRGTVTILR